MKKKLTNNFGVKLLSLGIAIVFWFVIINSQDPIESRIFRDIPVTVLNEEKVTEKEKILQVIEGDTVDVEVEGRRSELEDLTAGDFYATADMSEVSFMDTVLVRVSVPSHPDVKVLNDGENVMKLLFDDYVTERFSFRIHTVGEAMEDYFVGDALASPNIIQISGAKTLLDKIKEVVLEVDVSGRSVDFTATATPIVYDMNGDVISNSKLKMHMETEAVTVSVPVYPTKELRLQVKTVGEVPEGYEILEENIAFQPETVLVAGTKEDLAKLNTTLELQVDVTGQTGTIEKNIQIIEELNDNLKSLRVVNAQMAAVTVRVTPYVDKTIEIPADKIELKNLSAGLTAELVRKTPVLVTIQCKAVRAPFVTAEYLNPFVDLREFTEGTYQLQLEMAPPSRVQWNETILLDVVIRRETPGV